MARVVILASYTPSLRNFRGALIEQMCRNGHEVHAVAPDLLQYREREWLESLGVVCHEVSLSRSGLNPFADLSSFVALYRLLRRISPDVFLGYTIKPVIWGILAASLARVPKRVALITGLGYAFTGESTGVRKMVGSIARGLYRTALRNATLVFFQNSDDRDEFYRLGLLPQALHVEVVAGSGVDVSHFSVEPIPPEPIRFLLIARLLGDKGIREYVAAARLLRQRWPKVEFHLVGGADPSPDGIAEDEVRGWHESGDLVWHGALLDVRPIITSSHVYVLPSYREGTPRTVLEAMAMGRPIVTTNAPGCRQTVVEGENGFLVAVKDAESLAESMERFLYEPELIDRMGVKSRNRCEEIFDVQLVNTKMLKAMSLN